MALKPLIWALVTIFTLQSFLLSAAAKKTYIVRVKYHKKPASYSTHTEWYADHLRSVDSLLYSYGTAYHGFAATLDLEEVIALRRLDYVLGVYEDAVYTLHTTRTPKFLGIDSKIGGRIGLRLKEIDKASEDVIIGVLDTGFWPESKSFTNISDMPGPPTKWRGECEPGTDFDPKIHCNNKVIGARFFSKGLDQMLSTKKKRKNNVESHQSPRDMEGHGTHTASTIAGFEVANASLFGYAAGKSRGMATHARLAVYKVCWIEDCAKSDILAGMDSAIHDGVHILSLSMGLRGPEPYDQDPIAIGAFAAMEKGILVSCSAGNGGPIEGSVVNAAPWILTVGAGTIDRDFPAVATLGNGLKYKGVSLYNGEGIGQKKVRLVYFTNTNSSNNFCFPGSLESNAVRGKVVICDGFGSGGAGVVVAVKEAGGVGVILANINYFGEEAIPESYLLPTMAVGWKTGEKIKQYVKTHKNPTVMLSFGGTVLNVKPSPMVAGFSSRGPNSVSPQILKPDVIGPGVNILAAWSGAVGPTELPTDNRRTPFNIISGTSMSCPHVSGISALLKAAHPNWSPSAIKSALVTTAYTIDSTGSTLLDAFDLSSSTPWAYGAGHVDTLKALSPGLVYDATPEDHITFLCSSNHSIKEIETITNRPNVTCGRKFRDPGQLNYPSFAVVFNKSRVVRYTRELTNVGRDGSVYHASIVSPPAVRVDVKPDNLVFKKVGDKRRYTVTFKPEKGVDSSARSAFGSITWSNAKHQVNSPVSFSW
ncbi:subtilisin-like protease SBT1.8 [Primulina huaijiensis]|uniref:subtilisin-like protease SBT1.8 n=1 Tax=Primulina huaijiensis TaxID=1492673 RepID=UPI003CC78C99